MPDIPVLQPRRINFQMKLQAKAALTVNKRLILADGRGGKQRSPTGQIERIAMPMENSAVRQRAKAGCRSRLGQQHRTPPDFLPAARVDRLPQRARHELRAKANPQSRQILRQSPLQQFNLPPKKRKIIPIVNTNRPAQNHQKIGLRNERIGQIVNRRIAIRNLPTRRIENRASSPRSSNAT